MAPTFGVSFGLPQSGGYPINPFTGTPAINPYGHSIGPNGVNLGPVSVNPLLSLQVTKDEFGEKVVKPLVNLHVTPNHGLIHKIHGLKHKFFHDHHHHHVHNYKPIHYEKPHYPSYISKPHYSKPYYGYPEPYASQYDNYYDNYDHYPTGYNSDYPSNSGYYDNDYYDENSYYRNGKSLDLNVTSRLTTDNIQAINNYYSVPSSSSSISSNQQSSDRVAFPRNKRDVDGKNIEKVRTPCRRRK